MKRILMVEDEANLLAATSRGLETLPDVRVHGEPSADKALAFLRREGVDLVILDINLPGGSGLDVYDEIARSPAPVPVVVTTAYRSAYMAELERYAGVTLLEKPVPLQTLLQVVRQKLAAPAETPAGSAFQIVDYLQLAGLGQHSLVLKVELESGEQGRIDIVDGYIWNVFLGDRAGTEALSGLLSQPAAKISNAPLQKPPAVRQMCERPEAVLMEAAKGLDELTRDRGASFPEIWRAGNIACEQGWYDGHGHLDC